MKNAVSWFEIPATDLPRAKKFYEAIFEVKLDDMEFPNGLKMAAFPVDDGGVGGALAHYPEFYKPSAEGSLIYLNGGDDLQPILDRVEPNGGKTMMPKTQISEDIGYMSVFFDTEGNRVALFSRG